LRRRLYICTFIPKSKKYQIIKSTFHGKKWVLQLKLDRIITTRLLVYYAAIIWNLNLYECWPKAWLLIPIKPLGHWQIYWLQPFPSVTWKQSINQSIVYVKINKLASYQLITLILIAAITIRYLKNNQIINKSIVKVKINRFVHSIIYE